MAKKGRGVSQAQLRLFHLNPAKVPALEIGHLQNGIVTGVGGLEYHVFQTVFLPDEFVLLSAGAQAHGVEFLI